MPEILYHYTVIDTLELILKHRTIRFMSLTGLDDVEEGIIQDQQQFTKYCFVSSWTSDSKESIPMWNRYADTVKGVRISLLKHPFKRYKVNLQEQLKNIDVGLQLGANTVFSIDKGIIPESDVFNDDYSIVTNYDDRCLVKVAYTDDNDMLTPRLFTVNERGQYVMAWKMGIYKNTYWTFQKEWRYILRFLPIGYLDMVNDVFKNDSKKFIQTLQLCPDLPFVYKDLEIDEDVFNNMEITLSPMVTEIERVNVEELVSKYNPSAKVVDSVLQGRIR